MNLLILLLTATGTTILNLQPRDVGYGGSPIYITYPWLNALGWGCMIMAWLILGGVEIKKFIDKHIQK